MIGLGWQELAIVLVIVVIVFGAGKLPEIGGALGKGIKEFKSEAGEDGAIAPVAATGTRELRADQI